MDFIRKDIYVSISKYGCIFSYPYQDHLFIFRKVTKNRLFFFRKKGVLFPEHIKYLANLVYAHFKAKLHVLEEREGQLERNDGIRRAQATILRVYNSRFVAAIVMIRPSQDRTRPRCCSHLIWAGKGLASIGDNVWCPDYRVISSSSSRYQR